MSLFTSLLYAALAPRYRVTVEPEWGAGPIAGGADAARLYRTQPNLRAVVGFLADNAASVPWKVYDRVADGDRVRVTDSPAALLLARPNAHVTAYEWRRRLFADLYLYDRHLSIVVPDADAPSGWAMWPVPATWLDGYLGGSAWAPETLVLRVPATGRGVEVPASSCLWLHGYDPADPMRQSSPVEALADLLDEQMESATFRRQMWRRGGRFNAYVTRPKDVERWTNEAFERFRRTWNESWAGSGGSQAGAMPILEDGMEIRQVQFNARDAEWSEAKRLGREDVAGVYHVNPALIWPGSGQTYASAKENARALYNDTLAPRLMEATDKANAALLPMVGEPAGHYVEYDLAVKLQGSFEERAGVIQSAVGGPWMTRDEARAQFNLPHIDGADELIVPLNVTEGGLAAPNDTDPTRPRLSARSIGYVPGGVVYAMPQAGEKSDPAQDVRVEAVGGDAAPFGEGGARADRQAVTLLKTSSEPPEDVVAEVEAALTHAMERQARRVFADLRAGEGAAKARKDAGEGLPWWWDAARWDRELADDLEPLFRRLCDVRGMAAMSDIGEEAARWDSGRTGNFVRAMAERRADVFNEGTWQQLAAGLMEFDAGDPEAITAAERSFLGHAANRAARGARTFATAVCGFATKEAVRQAYPKDTDRVRRTKTWRHHGSKSPRSAHAAMDGETVGLDERFSNGADYPGDLGLPAQETVNCHCTIDVGVEKRGGTTDNDQEPVVSGGYGEVSGVWLSQFDNEQMWVERVDGSVFHKEGTPRGVILTNAEAENLVGGKARHTHTTEIGGTFGEDDLFTTAKLWLSEHEVHATISDTTYSLVRTSSATPDTALAMFDQYSEYSSGMLAGIRDFIAERDGVPASNPLSEEQLIEAETTLKEYQHVWLTENADSFGYMYGMHETG